MHCSATKAALIQCPLSAISRRAVSAIAISGQTPPSQFGRVVQITKLMPSSSTNRVCTLWYSLRSCRGLKARLLVPPLSAAATGNAGRWHADSTMRWFQNTPCSLRGNSKITLSRHAAERHFFEYGRRQTCDAIRYAIGWTPRASDEQRGDRFVHPFPASIGYDSLLKFPTLRKSQ